MKREEAIELLENLDGAIEDNQGRDYDEAFRMAIEALSTEAVSFEDAMQIRNTILVKEYLRGRRDADAEGSLKAIKRQIDEHWYLDPPSAEAVQGEWIIEDAHTEHCSVCGYAFYISALFAVGGNDEPNFCPNCGARMKGGAE